MRAREGEEEGESERSLWWWNAIVVGLDSGSAFVKILLRSLAERLPIAACRCSAVSLRGDLHPEISR